MTKNIKEIGKELMGKSLNSFHRKTGLTQLEENNKMQDGILNGILSQVDDAYIEKTEQSNVLHLDGSGDGIVAVDSIEGNTMVNLATVKTVSLSTVGSKTISNIIRKPNTKYTLMFDITSNDVTDESHEGIYLWATSNATISSSISAKVLKGKCIYTMTSTEDVKGWIIGCRNTLSGTIVLDNIVILEGDYTNKEVNFFEGLQSSFEEKVNDEGKYEIEILSQNRNLCNSNYFFKEISLDDGSEHNVDTIVTSDYTRVNPNKTYNTKLFDENNKSYSPLTNRCYDINKKYLGSFELNNLPSNCAFFRIRYLNKEGIDKTKKYRFMLTESSINNASYIEPKQNKIKLLINEPLRGINNAIKDKLCVNDNKLVVERNCGTVIVDGSEPWAKYMEKQDGIWEYYIPRDYYIQIKEESKMIADKIICYQDTTPIHQRTFPCIVGGILHWRLFFQCALTSLEEFRQWLANNPIKVIYELEEPYYEEVLNEYGEPIILEGYENGTIYIDSTIAPTTTVRYTPKMESLNTLKEVNNNNVMLTNDINDMIVPYMMEVDLMIMEKEVALMNHKNIRKIGEKDMTNMQKRTYDMLARLIKGKTLNEQECKTRVTVYLNAGKITDEQAKELNFLIDEIYA